MILDTNALSALAARDPALLEKIGHLPRLTLNLVSLGEYRYGIDGSSQRERLMEWLDQVIDRSVVLCAGLETLPHYSRIRHKLKQAGTPIPANDVWIAALCREHRLPVLSRDRHFDLVEGVERIDW